MNWIQRFLTGIATHKADTDAHHAKLHEGDHVAGGVDDIDSALAIAAMANLTSTMIWQGNVGNRPVEVAMPAVGAQISSGTYTGDGSDNRAIPHGLGVTPKVVLITCTNSNGDIYNGWILGGYQVAFQGTRYNCTDPNTTNFYVSDEANTNLNTTDATYAWVAIG